MSKYSNEFKLEVINYCINGHHSYADAEKHFGVNHESLRKWIKKYQEHRTSRLIKNNIKYDGCFKQNVVEYMHTNYLSLAKTCVKFNLRNHNIVGKRERIYYEESPKALLMEK